MTEFSTVLECDFFPLCSGCQRQGDVSSPPIWQTVRDFFQKSAPNLPVALVRGPTTHWRVRSRLAVRGSSRAPEIGLFKQHSHQVVPIPTCPLHHPSINPVCAKVKEAITECNIEPYDEVGGWGILRYLQCVALRKTGDVQLTLCVNQQANDAALEAFVKRIYSSGGLHSVWLNFQPHQTNRILGDRWDLCEGEDILWERLGVADCAFHPAAFGQANPDLFEKALHRIREWTEPGKTLLELYAGIGVIGLNLAAESKQTLCVEINPFALPSFHLSRQRLPQEAQHRISMQILSAADAAPLIAEHEVIIVDPPRKGLDQKVLDALCEASPGSQLIYMSCGPISFQKDAEKLFSHGWQIEKAECYLFFPGTDHVEVLCLFRKQFTT